MRWPTCRFAVGGVFGKFARGRQRPRWKQTVCSIEGGTQNLARAWPLWRGARAACRRVAPRMGSGFPWFFQRLGASDVPSAHDLFQSISGFPYDGSKDSEMVHQISDFERNEELLTFDDPRQKVYPFDFCWKASQSQREKTQMGQPEVPLSE